MEETLDDGQPHDLQIKSDRPVLDVVEVVLVALFEGRVATPAVHLSPASQTGLDFVTKHVLRDSVLELLDEVRALRSRSHDGHVAAKHVPELGKLVEIRSTKKASK